MAKLHIWTNDLKLSAMEHDYRPDWDYETMPPPGGRQREDLDGAILQIERDVMPALGMDDAAIFTVKENTLGDRVGLYVNGTSSCPFIGIDVGKLLREAGQEGFRNEVIATIVHELGHAYLDEAGVDEEEGDADYEAGVEEFAQHYLETGQADLGPIDFQITVAAFRE